jgi:hypothetical protein
MNSPHRDDSSGRTNGSRERLPEMVLGSQRLATGAVLGAMTVVGVGVALALQGILAMPAGAVLRYLAMAAAVGAFAGGWISGRWPLVSAAAIGPATTAAFWAMISRTAAAARHGALPAQAESLFAPLAWLIPLVLVACSLLAYGAARLRKRLS